MIPGGSNDGRLTDVGTASLIRAYIGQLLVVATSDRDSVAALISVGIVVYECSDTVEQRMIPGGNNDARQTDVDSTMLHM